MGHADSVRGRLDSLTKPPGSLGQLEDIVVRYASIRGETMPSIARKGAYIFCADHGVSAEGVSPYPASVTREMVANFIRGGAAINVLCRQHGFSPVIVDMGVDGPPVPGSLNRKAGPGTRNMAVQPAMTVEQAQFCLDAGAAQADDASRRFDFVALGEMGIGNTTAAAAVLAAITGLDPFAVAGPGAGLDQDGIRHKADVIARSLALHRPDPSDGRSVLACVGGFELGAIAGFLLRAAELRLPVVLDGFPCCAGALIARAIRPDALKTCFFGHVSAERGHALLLDTLGARPLLSLGMRLGEGTGAVLAASIIEAAVRLYREMATFEEASVARQTQPTGAPC